jgi:Dihydro-orotase-like
MKRPILLTALFALSFNFIYAQSKAWTWADYKMKFQAPNDFSIKESSGAIFSAGNEHLTLTIYPKKGENLTYARMKDALQKWARDNKVDWNSDNLGYMSSLNRYWGYYIDGTGENGLPTSLLLLVDPDYPEYSFYVWLQYQSGYLDTAVDILKSFKPM